jgi:nucleoside 2-deoxyribosyltransferase
MIIYLAGSIRPHGNQTLEGNVATAKQLALDLWKKGYTVFCPHANSDLPISLADKEVEAQRWLNGDLEILSKCDALVVMSEWNLSQGTIGEMVHAKKLGIPIYFYPDLPELLEEGL